MYFMTYSTSYSHSHCQILGLFVHVHICIYFVYVHVMIVLESEYTLAWTMSLWIPCHSFTVQCNLLSCSPQIHNYCRSVENYWKYSSKENCLFALVSCNETHRGCAGKGPYCLECGIKWMTVVSMILQPSTMELWIHYIFKITGHYPRLGAGALWHSWQWGGW